jgi:hypothetical protein
MWWVPFRNEPWGWMDPNDVGLDEFLRFCELVDARPLICVSYSDDPDSARDLVAYGDAGCHDAPDQERRVRHSMTVAGWMEVLSGSYGEDMDAWYLTGLLHDLDLPETMDDLSRRGLLAAKKLEGLLPAASIDAIMAHDPGTGIPARTELARALIFSDVLDNLTANAGLEVVADCARRKAWDELRRRFPAKEYHVGVVEAFDRLRPGSVVRLLPSG